MASADSDVIDTPAARVLRRIDELGAKPATIAKQAGLGPDLIRDMIRRPEQSPTLRTIEALAGPLKTTPEWLAFGIERGKRRIKLHGLVGDGAVIDDSEEARLPGRVTVEIPDDGSLAALIVRGDSQKSRFLDGEIVLFDPRPSPIDELVGQYAIVDTCDGRRLIKRIARGLGDNKWQLLSHNADPENDVELIRAHRYLGLLPQTEATKRASSEQSAAQKRRRAAPQAVRRRPR